jgi:hypothetical protein
MRAPERGNHALAAHPRIDGDPQRRMRRRCVGARTTLAEIADPFPVTRVSLQPVPDTDMTTKDTTIVDNRSGRVAS